VNVVELSPNGSVQQSVSILTGNDGGYAVAIHPNQKYSIGVDNKDCYEVDGPFTISTAALGLWDTTYIRQDFTVRYQPLHVELNSAIVPFFVTGFWRLNTRAGYQQFARRYSPIGDLEHLTNINGHDYNYAEGSATVDRVLDDSVYTPILNRLLPQLTRSCYDSNYYLDIAVTGFTDRSPITDGDSNLYRDSDVVHYGDSTLHSGDRLNGPQAGNVKLSVLRAYYAEKEILAALMRDATFAKYYSEGRIEIHSHGAGISEKYSDLAHNRRIDITASVVRRR